MLTQFSRRRVSRISFIGLISLLFVVSSVVSISHGNVTTFAESEEPIEVLLVLDHDYGGNVPHIITIFERFEWSITTTGLNKTLTSCDYLGDAVFTVDLLMTEISDISQFDAISIMPGNSHELLRTNQTSLNLINSAVDQDLIVSAWCRGVRVLAAADVISGKNVTGSADFAAEYEAAGATFTSLVPPIIDGNIVTGVRSRFYRDEMCQAIATALGVYEPDAPVLVSSIITPHQGVLGSTVNLTAEFSDVTGVYNVNAKIFALNETSGDRISVVYEQYFALNTTSTEGRFTGTIEDLDLGKYTVDLEALDLYLNEAVYSDVVNISIVEQNTPPDWSGLIQWVIPGAMTGFAAVVVLVVYLRRR
jgi:putative intracellular protease/amidase